MIKSLSNVESNLKIPKIYSNKSKRLFIVMYRGFSWFSLSLLLAVLIPILCLLFGVALLPDWEFEDKR